MADVEEAEVLRKRVTVDLIFRRGAAYLTMGGAAICAFACGSEDGKGRGIRMLEDKAKKMTKNSWKANLQTPLQRVCLVERDAP